MYEAELEAEIVKQFNEYLNSVLDKVTLILLKAISRAVYDAYSPTVYERRHQLYNLDYKIENNELMLFISDEISYRSAVDGRDVSQAVPYWVEVGHNDKSPIMNQYHHYGMFGGNGTKYLEMAQQLIKHELDIDVVIINDKPPNV